ncbi:hypothetical protein HanIR_Chr02g0070781 [Helianthus annuus]|nr:hypothetical protein HanIR_Chr02g0070781 [Helianthus annuus]
MHVVLQLPFASSFPIRDPQHLYELGTCKMKTETDGWLVDALGREEREQERE